MQGEGQLSVSDGIASAQEVCVDSLDVSIGERHIKLLATQFEVLCVNDPLANCVQLLEFLQNEVSMRAEFPFDAPPMSFFFLELFGRKLLDLWKHFLDGSAFVEGKLFENVLSLTCLSDFGANGQQEFRILNEFRESRVCELAHNLFNSDAVAVLNQLAHEQQEFFSADSP